MNSLLEKLVTQCQGIVDFSNDELITINNEINGMWDELPPTSLLTTRNGQSAPTLTTFEGDVNQLTFGIGNEVFGRTEVINQYANEADLYLHLLLANDNGDEFRAGLRFEFEYTVRNEFEIFSSSTVTTNEFFIESDTPSKTHFICGLTVIPVPIAKFGVYIDWRIKRISTETLPPPSENPFLLALCSYVDHKNN